jgi:hypothetical protein
VLSSQRVPLQDAIFNAIKDKQKKEETTNPLVAEGEKLIPSVTRVFSKSREMYIYLQAYEQGVEPTRPLVAFATLYGAGGKALETPPVKLTESWNNRVKTMPLKFNVPLGGLLAGSRGDRPLNRPRRRIPPQIAGPFSTAPAQCATVDWDRSNNSTAERVLRHW